jgi:hypothetical protein
VCEVPYTSAENRGEQLVERRKENCNIAVGGRLSAPGFVSLLGATPTASLWGKGIANSGRHDGTGSARQRALVRILHFC